MGTFNPKSFSEPDRLKTIAPHRLRAFLTPHETYLRDRGLALPSDADGDVDHDSLAQILMHPNDQVPNAMVDALYYVDEMANDEGMDRLMEATSAADIHLDLGPIPTSADVAIAAWLIRPDLLRRVHAETYALKQKKFVWYQSRLTGPRPFPAWGEPLLARLQDHLDDWFETRKRGRNSRVMIFRRGDVVWIVVRHGQTFKREGSIREGKSSTEYYRPEKYDVLLYDLVHGTLGIHADGKRLIEFYLHSVGLFFFEDDGYFAFEHKLSLDPLKIHGRESLNCGDILGIDEIRLVELTRFRGGPLKRTTVDKATDVFAALEEDGYSLSPTARLASAVLEIMFTGEEKPRRVTLRLPHIIVYARNEDRDLVDAFLRARGFLPKTADRPSSASVLAGS
jgi:hypothetical protein